MASAPELLLELSIAAASAGTVIPRRERFRRVRLERAVQAIQRHAGHLVVIERPTREGALAQFAHAMEAALKAGVNRADLVVLFNGDDDR